LPADASAEIEPTSTWPKPSADRQATARALLSKPAASPSGVRIEMPATSVARHWLGVPARAAIEEQSQPRSPAHSAAPIARPCARSGSAANNSGRSSER